VCSPFFFFFSIWLDLIESGTYTIERVDQRSSQANVGGLDSVSQAISLLGRCLTPTRTRGLTTMKTELTQNKDQNLDLLRRRLETRDANTEKMISD
jgi:hypothetical protein